MTIKQLFLLALLAIPTTGYSMDSSNSSSLQTTINQLLASYDAVMPNFDSTPLFAAPIIMPTLQDCVNQQQLALAFVVLINRAFSPQAQAIWSRKDLTSSAKWQLTKNQIDFYAEPTEKEKLFAAALLTECAQ